MEGKERLSKARLRGILSCMVQSLVEAPTPTPLPDRDDIVVLRNVSWADYQRILEIRGDEPAPRLSYLEGVLELRA